MKKLSLLFSLICIVAIPSAAFASVNIIPRAEWGADESFTFANPAPTLSLDSGTSSELEEQSEIIQQDPEIERVVTTDASGNRYTWPLQYAKEIKFIVIHYTAVTNNLDNPLQDIKNIYHSHAIGRGWGDIGYNFLIDRQGNIYEGRKGGDKVIGGHAKPVNKVSVGIALMGNYNDEELPAPMLESLISLTDMLTRKYNIDPAGQTGYKGKTYSNIQGHEDNSAKIDPGVYGRQKLPLLRQLLAYRQGKINLPTTDKYNFSLISPKDLMVAAPDAKKEFSIRIKNSSKRIWNGDTYLENMDDAKLPRVFAKITKRTAANAIAEFKGTLPGLMISGMRMPTVKLVVNGTLPQDKWLPIPIMITGLKADYEIVGRSDPPATMIAGEKATAWIVLKNTGNFTWKRSGKNAVKMGASRTQDHSSPLFAGKNRVAKLVENRVAPGQEGKFIFTVQAGSPAGTYQEYFAPVIDGAMWLPDKGLHFTVEVQTQEKPLRVALSGFTGKSAKIKSASGMELYEGGVFVKEIAQNQTATFVSRNNQYEVKTGAEKITLKSPPRLKAKNNGILIVSSLNDNSYRGMVEIRKVDGKLALINELPLEDYLKGIAEISNNAPTEKIKTIIILARSYALYYRDIGRKFPGKPYDLDDDPNHTQKYSGYGVESRSPNTVAAVNATAGKIVTYQGRQVITPYFSQSDGRTRSAQEVWGWTDRPYLQSVPDTFCGSTELRGHGVGLSGCGATALANAGKSAEEIIKYYYQGVEITDGK